MRRMRAAWIDIDLDAIVHNVEEVTNLVRRDRDKNTIPMPIIKGNAYGHGIYEVARVLYQEGITYFGVAIYEEALLVREAAPKGNVLILGYTPDDLAEDLIKHRITPTVYTFRQAAVLSQTAARLHAIAKVHVKLDTGMHRLGFPCTEESVDAIKAITQLPALQVEGIFTHFATSHMKEKNYVFTQYNNYCTFLKKLQQRDIEIPLKHISNTGIILDNPEMNQDMVRFGSMVFGTFSSLDIHTERVSLKDTFALRAEIAYVKELAAGEGIGYDLAFVTKRQSKIATLPLGYADIGIRKLKNTGSVLLHGKRVPIVGGICMDQMMIDVTGIDAKIGDTVTIIGKDGDEQITLQEVAEHIGTDSYEVIISANQRLPRRYWRKGCLYSELDENLVLAEYYAGKRTARTEL